MAANEPVYPDGDDVVSRLPGGTAVDPEDAQRFVDSAVADLGSCHVSGVAPVNHTTVGLVWQRAYANALKQHFVQGEGYIETPAADSELDRADRAFSSYCEGIREREAPGGPGQAGGDLVAEFGTSPF